MRFSNKNIWQTIKLNEYADFLQGLTYSPNNVSTTGRLVLRSSNIQNSKLDFSDKVYVNMDIPAKISTKENDVLMCVRNGSKNLVGKTALITKEFENLAWGAFMNIIRPRDGKTFLFHFLNSQYFKNQIKADLNTATVNQITIGTLNQCKISIPLSEIEKDKICIFFDLLDQRINTQSKIIDNLQSQIKWLCHKFFKGYKSNGKATIFDDLFVEYKELNNENHTQYTIGKYGIKEMKDDHVAYSTNSHIVFLPCSLILGIGIDEIGVSKDLVGCCSPIYKTYKINTNILLPSFFNFYANFYFNEVKRFITQKSTRREFEFDYKALHKICFNIPSIETQGEHAKLLETFMQKLQKEKDILSLYKKQKAYLLKNLFI